MNIKKKKNHFISCLLHFDGRETTSSFKKTVIKNRWGKDWSKQRSTTTTLVTLHHTHSHKQYRGLGPVCASREGRNSWSGAPVWQKRGSCWLVKFYLMEENESGTWEIQFEVLKLPNSWKAGRCRWGRVGAWAARDSLSAGSDLVFYSPPSPLQSGAYFSRNIVIHGD